MAFMASAFSAMTKDTSQMKRPKASYNYATGQHEKDKAVQYNAHQWWTGHKGLPLDKLRRKHNPTDHRVSTALDDAGV